MDISAADEFRLCGSGDLRTIMTDNGKVICRDRSINLRCHIVVRVNVSTQGSALGVSFDGSIQFADLAADIYMTAFDLCLLPACFADCHIRVKCIFNSILDIRTYSQTGAVCRRVDVHFFNRRVAADRDCVETIKDLHAAADHDIEIVFNIHFGLDCSEIDGSCRVDHRFGLNVVGCTAVVQNIDIAVIGFQCRIITNCDLARTVQPILRPKRIAGEEASACRVGFGIQYRIRVVHDCNAFFSGEGTVHFHGIVRVDLIFAHREVCIDAEANSHAVRYTRCNRSVIGFNGNISACSHICPALDVGICLIVAMRRQSCDGHVLCTDNQTLLDLCIHGSGVLSQYIDIAASLDNAAAYSGADALRDVFGKGAIGCFVEGADAGVRLRVRSVRDTDITAVF